MREVVLPGTAFPHAARPLSAALTGRIYTTAGRCARGSAGACVPRVARVAAAGTRSFGVEAVAVAVPSPLRSRCRVRVVDAACPRARSGRARATSGAVVPGASVVAPSGGLSLPRAVAVLAEERLRVERLLGRREVPQKLPLAARHVVAPDLRRERAAGDVGAVVEAVIACGLGVADPDRGREARREADEPGVGEVVGRARSCRPPGSRSAPWCRCRSGRSARGSSSPWRSRRRGTHRALGLRARQLLAPVGERTSVIAVGRLRQPPEAIVA